MKRQETCSDFKQDMEESGLWGVFDWETAFQPLQWKFWESNQEKQECDSEKSKLSWFFVWYM